MPAGTTLRILTWPGPDASARPVQGLCRSAACQPYLRGVTIGFVARVTCTVCANGGTDGPAPVIPARTRLVRVGREPGMLSSIALHAGELLAAGLLAGVVFVALVAAGGL